MITLTLEQAASISEALAAGEGLAESVEGEESRLSLIASAARMMDEVNSQKRSIRIDMVVPDKYGRAYLVTYMREGKHDQCRRQMHWDEVLSAQHNWMTEGVAAFTEPFWASCE